MVFYIYRTYYSPAPSWQVLPLPHVTGGQSPLQITLGQSGVWGLSAGPEQGHLDVWVQYHINERMFSKVQETYKHACPEK